MTRRPALAALALAGALLAGSLAGCGGGSGSSASPGSGSSGSGSSASTTGTPSGSSSGPPAVEGVTLTAQGSRLRLGQSARVSWEPDQHTVGVLGLQVTSVQRVPISAFSDWRLDRATRRSTPYYVHVAVRNLGHSNLSGQPVPLYLLDRRDVLHQASTFQAQYRPCPSRPLPRKFTHGKRTTACLVYFVPDHGGLAAISFRPSQDFDAITWRGRVRH